MQRAALLLTALAAFSAAPSAHAASVQIVSDQATYLLGDTVTLSIVATASSGEMATSVCARGARARLRARHLLFERS